MTRPRSMNPGIHFATARASVAAIRPSAPTEHPFEPPKRYACIGCGVVVELDLLDPPPDGWVTVQGASPGAGVGYRCASCARAAKKPAAKKPAAKKGRRS